MNSDKFDWRARLILRQLEAGATIREASEAARISRQAVTKRRRRSPSFADAVVAAREMGRDERRYRAWLNHPFRGKRPPAGRGHGGAPSFRFGRR